MKIQFHRPVRARAFFMIEIMIYMALWVMVAGLAFSAFYKYLTGCRDLNRQATDIVRAIQAGERWRADLRDAVAPPRIITEGPSTALEISKRTGVAVYIFEKDVVWRRPHPDARWEIALAGVKNSRMQPMLRGKVAAWNWELELMTKRKNPRVLPLFSFFGVAGSAEKL